MADSRAFWYAQVYAAVLDGYENVAVKFVPPNAMANAAQQGVNVQSEISIMRACRHDNIVGFLGAWLDEVSFRAGHAHPQVESIWL